MWSTKSEEEKRRYAAWTFEDCYLVCILLFHNEISHQTSLVKHLPNFSSYFEAFPVKTWPPDLQHGKSSENFERRWQPFRWIRGPCNSPERLLHEDSNIQQWIPFRCKYFEMNLLGSKKSHNRPKMVSNSRLSLVQMYGRYSWLCSFLSLHHFT